MRLSRFTGLAGPGLRAFWGGGGLVSAPRLITRPVRVFAIPLLVAGLAAGMTPATAAASRTRPAGPSASFTIDGQLNGVAATSASNAWAVGSTSSSTSNPKTLIVRWNGTAWMRVPSPSAGASSSLSGVAAISASDAWAVGSLILRWNGTTWAQVPGPAANGVAATSASNAWAVGGTGTKTVILHWNGTAWTQVPSPSPAGHTVLSGVAAISASNAWAVGTTITSAGIHKTLILRWNG